MPEMVRYVSATQRRLWDVFTHGVPNWSTRVRPANEMKYLDLQTTARSEAKRFGAMRQPSDFPALSILPQTFSDLGYTAPTASMFATRGASPLRDAPIVTAEAVTFAVRLTFDGLDYGVSDELWVPMKVALYRAGNKLAVRDAAGAVLSEGLPYVRSWSIPAGRYSPENEGRDRLVVVADLRVEYAFRTADIVGTP